MTRLSSGTPDDDAPDDEEHGGGEHGDVRRHGKPDNEVPVAVPIEETVAATADLAVFFAGLLVYSSGVEFTLEARGRPGVDLGEIDGVWEAFHGHGSATNRLLLGVEYADGRRGAAIDGPFGFASGGGVSLRAHGSGGGGRSASATFYLSPLPPPGELRIYCAWPAAGIEETVTTIDAGRILAVTDRVRELWPWEPERQERYRPVRPRVPAGGWFASFVDDEEPDQDRAPSRPPLA